MALQIAAVYATLSNVLFPPEHMRSHHLNTTECEGITRHECNQNCFTSTELCAGRKRRTE